MKFDAAQSTKLARETGLLADNLEKALRLRELLTELHKHPFLSGKLVLKGGTALNLYEQNNSHSWTIRPSPDKRSVRRWAATLYAGHVQQLGGANPLPNLMEVKG